MVEDDGPTLSELGAAALDNLAALALNVSKDLTSDEAKAQYALVYNSTKTTLLSDCPDCRKVLVQVAGSDYEATAVPVYAAIAAACAAAAGALLLCRLLMATYKCVEDAGVALWGACFACVTCSCFRSAPAARARPVLRRPPPARRGRGRARDVEMDSLVSSVFDDESESEDESIFTDDESIFDDEAPRPRRPLPRPVPRPKPRPKPRPSSPPPLAAVPEAPPPKPAPVVPKPPPIEAMLYVEDGADSFMLDLELDSVSSSKVLKERLITAFNQAFGRPPLIAHDLVVHAQDTAGGWAPVTDYSAWRHLKECTKFAVARGGAHTLTLHASQAAPPSASTKICCAEAAKRCSSAPAGGGAVDTQPMLKPSAVALHQAGNLNSAGQPKRGSRGKGPKRK